MLRASLIALAFSASCVLAASLDCPPSDSQCLAEGDTSAMIQVSASQGDQASPTDSVKDIEAKASDVAKDIEGKASDVVKDIQATASDPNMTFRPASFKPIPSWYSQFYGVMNSSYSKRVWMAFTSWVIYVIFALVIWTCCYPGPPVQAANPAGIEDPSDTLSKGHFSCLSSPGILCCACCCPGLRWADTMSSVGFLKITTGLSLAFFCAFLNGFANTCAVFGPFTILLALYYRQKLREEFKLSSWTCSNLCFDTLYIVICPWCALAQEARVVTHAMQRGEVKA